MEEEDFAVGGECIGVFGVEFDDASDVLIAVITEVVGFDLLQVLAHEILLCSWGEFDAGDELSQVVGNTFILILEVTLFPSEDGPQHFLQFPIVSRLQYLPFLCILHQEGEGNVLPHCPVVFGEEFINIGSEESIHQYFP